jgi:hypothetical protein
VSWESWRCKEPGQPFFCLLEATLARRGPLRGEIRHRLHARSGAELLCEVKRDPAVSFLGSSSSTTSFHIVAVSSPRLAALWRGGRCKPMTSMGAPKNPISRAVLTKRSAWLGRRWSSLRWGGRFQFSRATVRARKRDRNPWGDGRGGRGRMTAI